jgi:hypothetical protein
MSGNATLTPFVALAAIGVRIAGAATSACVSCESVAVAALQQRPTDRRSVSPKKHRTVHFDAQRAFFFRQSTTV